MSLRDIVRDLRASLPHWREWGAAYRSLSRLRLRAPAARVRRLWRRRRKYFTPHPRTVILLPGIYETAEDMRVLAAALARRGHRIRRIRLARQVVPLPLLRTRVERYLRKHDLRDVVVLAHSKGGLLGKHVMMGPEGERIDRMIALATPWHGSQYAALFWPGLGVRSLRPGTTLIAAAEAPSPSDARIISVQPRFDPHVPLGSHLPGARNIDVDTAGHFAVLTDPAVVELVVQLVEERS